MTQHRSRTLPTLCILLALTVPALAAAPSKEMIQLQTQVQELQDAIARLTQANDERFGVITDLVKQNSDSVNKLAFGLDTLQKQVMGIQSTQATKADQVSGQVQSLNDSVDEVKAKLNNLQKMLQDIQNQQQTIGASLQSLAPPASLPVPTPDTAAPLPENPAPGSPANNASPKRGKPAAGVPLSPAPTTAAADSSPMPSIQPASQLFSAALSDYMAAKYPLSTTEFNDVIKNYPEDPLSGNAYYYLGEIEYRAGHFSNAIKDYDHVLDQYPDSSHTAVSHLHKGQALLTLYAASRDPKQRDAGVREYQILIQRFPNSNESSTARSRLSALGVTVPPRKP
jgi:TolA-binding protein